MQWIRPRVTFASWLKIGRTTYFLLILAGLVKYERNARKVRSAQGYQKCKHIHQNPREEFSEILRSDFRSGSTGRSSQRSIRVHERTELRGNRG